MRRRAERVVSRAHEDAVQILPRYGWVAGFLFLYAFMLREVTLGRPYAFGDLPPYLGRDALATFTSTWQYSQLGFPHHYTTLSGYFGAVTVVGGTLARWTGADPQAGRVLAQNLLFLSFIPAGFATFAVFAGRFVDDRAARYVAAGVYVINPITIGEFVNGGANEFLAFVGGPLVLHYLWRTAETDDWLPVLLAGVVFGATAVIPWTAFWLIAPFITYLLVQHRREWRVVAKFVAAGAVGIALALPSVFYLVQRAVGLDGTGAMFAQLEWNYRAATAPSLLRLAGNHGSYAMTELGYNSEPAMLVGLVIPAVGLLAWSNRRLLFCYPIAAALVGFMVLTHHGVTYPLFEAVPPLWSLRNPAKLQYPLLLSLSLLFGGGLGTVLRRVDGAESGAIRGTGTRSAGRDWDASAAVRGGLGGLGGLAGRDRPLVSGAGLVRATIVGLVVLSLFSYAAPAGGGTLGLEETRGDEYYVPAEYEEVADRLDGRALWLPYSYTTQLRLRAAYPNHVGVQSGALETGKPNARYVDDLFRDVAAGKAVRGRLADLGVRHVVVDHSEQQRYPASEGVPRTEVRHRAPWLFGDPAAFDERLAEADGYTREFTTGQLTVYRVEGVPERDRVEQYEGLHRAYYPTTADPEPVEESVLANGDFADGLDGWWTWSGDDGTQTTVANTSGGRAARLVTESGDTYPIAQQAAVRNRSPYRLDVDADGAGTVALYWYDGAKSEENRTGRERYALDALPRTVTARGDRVSVRVRPNGSRLRVDEVTLRRTTHPARTDLAGNTAGIPGVVVDGRASNVTAGAAVAVNLNASRRAALDPDVAIRDAEQALDGELVFDARYRQGVAVRTPDDGPPSAIPDDAEVVTHDAPNGTVIDYWVVGEFDRTPVTVLDTTYDERWTAGPDAQQFAAYGWANGFTNADPGDVRWTGGDGRRAMIRLWIGLWLLALVGVGGLWLRRQWQRRQQPTDPLRL